MLAFEAQHVQSSDHVTEHALAGRAIEAMSDISKMWQQTVETSSHRYLGIWLGSSSDLDRFDAIISKMQSCVGYTQEMALGMPAMLGLAGIVVLVGCFSYS